MSRQDPNKLVKQANELRNDGHALEAVEIYKQAAELFDKINQPVEAADCIHMIGVSYKIDNNRDKAMPHYEDAIRRFEELDRYDKVGSVERDIGIMHAYYKDYDLALKWLKKSETALTSADNLSELGITQSKIGLIYIYLKEYSLAEKGLKKGLSTLQAAQQPHNFYIMTTLLHLASLEIVQQHYKQTLTYVNQAYDLLPHVEKEEGSMHRRYSQILGIRAHAYFGLDQVKQATQDTIDSFRYLEDVSDDTASVVYEDIKADKLLNLLKKNNPEGYKKASQLFDIVRIKRLSTNK